MNDLQQNNLRPVDHESCRRLAADMDIPYSIAVLLGQRGITDRETAAAFLHPKLAELPSPFLLKDMDEAVELVLDIMREQGRIIIHGDYDVDGISGCALLSLFFQKIGIVTTCYQPNRLTEGYGVQKGIIEEHRPGYNEDVLLLTVDCGISSIDEIAYAKKIGYKIIVTDHHQPPETLPDADAILNPQRQDCPFPYKELAGVGVAFLLAMGIRSRMVEKNLINRENIPNIKHLLSLVALGTVADVMPLTGMNRILVRAGLEVMEIRAIPWIWALCEKAGLREGPVTAEDISYRLGPRINAPGRLGVPDTAFRFLTSSDTVSAIELADELETVNIQRRELEKDILTDIFEGCSEQALKGKYGLVVAGDYHPGIIGVIASKIVDQFSKPAILLTEDAVDRNLLKGSGRSVVGINLFEILKSCADNLVQYGGHSMAAGMTIRKEHLEQFAGHFDRAVRDASQTLDEHTVDRSMTYHYQLREDDFFDGRFLYYYHLLGPFGSGNPEPLFLLKNLSVKNAYVIHTHLKYTFDLNGKNYRGIGFGMAEKLQLVQSQPINLIFKLKKNVYKGGEYIELHAVDMEASPQ